jgi:hypothetical protein
VEQKAVIHGRAAGLTFDYVARLVAASDKEAFLITDSDPPHQAHVRVRHEGAVLGGRPSTTCGFEWDGEYISLAMYRVNPDGSVEIEPEDY